MLLMTRRMMSHMNMSPYENVVCARQLRSSAHTALYFVIFACLFVFFTRHRSQNTFESRERVSE